MGSNDFCQLGRDGASSIPRCIQSLDAFIVRDVAVGEDYCVVCTSVGSCFAWGKSDKVCARGCVAPRDRA